MEELNFKRIRILFVIFIKSWLHKRLYKHIYIAKGTLTWLLKVPDKEPCKGLFLSIAYIQERLEWLGLV